MLDREVVRSIFATVGTIKVCCELIYSCQIYAPSGLEDVVMSWRILSTTTQAPVAFFRLKTSTMSLTSRLNSSLARIFLFRTMSSIAHGPVLQGSCWDYRIIGALKGDRTHSSTVFKAKVLPHNSAQNFPKLFVV